MDKASGIYLQNMNMTEIAERLEDCPVAVARQVNGFAPNFVHSIDASHMMASAIVCGDAGIRFAAVHDSYWTHAADVPAMARILREQFAALHESPLLAELHAELRRTYPNLDLPDPPEPSDFDLGQVIRSDYFFS